MRIDYHTHHERCGHAIGTLREMVEKAAQAGLDQVGLSDHSPLYFLEPDHPSPGMAMAKSEFDHYVAEMIRLRDEFAGRIEVKLGVESDYIEGWEKVYRQVYSRYPFDYIIGSVHYFGGYHVFNPQRWESNPDPDEVCRHYFQLVRQSAASGLFDILGHIDAIKALGHVPVDSLKKEWDLTAKAIHEADVAVELNTSGIRKCKEIFPSYELLARLHRYGVPFTFGSDAHRPEELAFGFEEAIDVLKSLGVKEIATFAKRRRIMVPLP